MGDQLLYHTTPSPTGALLQGRIELVLARCGELTRPRRSLAAPPLQLSRVRYDDPEHPGQAVFTMLQLGAVLAGDRSAIRVELEERATATLRGAAATQVLAMPAGEATLTTELRLGAGSRLRWLPEPLILCTGARYRQFTRVELGADARLTMLDIFVPGRLARGERFRFSRFESRLEVYDPASRLLVAERALLEPARHDPTAPGLFGALPVLGSLYLLGTGQDAERLCDLAAGHCGESAGAALLPNRAGLLVRTLGASASDARSTLLSLLGKITG